MRNIFILLLVLLPLHGLTQKSDFGNWLNYFGSKTIKDNFNWHHEAQYRNYNEIGDLEQLLLRTGLGYNLTENNNNILLGYGFIRSENYIGTTDEKAIINEHRIYQQFITKQSFGRVSFQHRYRFEQRFVEDKFRMRFRYFLSTNIALTNPTIVDNTFYLSAYNEIFLNTTKTIFDRNRLYGGLGYKLNNNLRFEVAYMNQFLDKRQRDQLNINIFLNL
ncbi:DUF2490 domain-containing protein [Brumimicrobium oceani]|uniref:DUF2490 domain-containing protein n=1 Tax=Brumimicrobium oceani TaxID=2100725 RepID=A0A2U2XE19_9FLAO|nr:DUF2490 domain-containing protein [Brumimicrobium oceani]PWH85986.1 DUF2490 domain-containing protein [Brumimicrobium oceani]PWH85987.1 DUF2490 domain-containing protein [Brumimicrobium oceani]